MADRKISDLTALTTPASGDYLPIVDISEASAANKNKRITIEELLRGAPDGTAAAPGIAFESDPNTGIYSPGADQVAISTNGTGRLFVDATGKVTVNQATDGVPSINIESDNDGRSRTILRFTDTDVATAADQPLGVIQFYGSDTSGAGAGIKSTIGAYSASANGDSYLTFSTATSALNNQERLRITSAGLVGIGTTSPGSALQVNGTGGIRVNEDGAGTNQIQLRSDWAGQGPAINVQTNQSLLFTTNATERVRIDSSGRVGIGTTSPTAPLCVQGAANSDQLIVTGSNGLSRGLKISTGVDYANDSLVKYDSQYASGAEYGAHAFLTGGQERLRIDRSGRLLVGTSSARTVEYTPGTAGTPKFQVEGNDGASSQILITDTRLDGRHPQLAFAKTRNGAIVVSGDTLGSIGFFGDDGTDTRSWGGRIACEVDGTPGANDMPGRLVFSVTADGASSPTEAMRIKNSRILNFANTPVYADNAAAKTGGLVDGDVYRKSDGTLMIVYT